jgi:hypothetical protein
VYSATDTDGDQHQRQQTMSANHAAFDPIFIQYIITVQEMIVILLHQIQTAYAPALMVMGLISRSEIFEK